MGSNWTTSAAVHTVRRVAAQLLKYTAHGSGYWNIVTIIVMTFFLVHFLIGATNKFQFADSSDATLDGVTNALCSLSMTVRLLGIIQVII